MQLYAAMFYVSVACASACAALLLWAIICGACNKELDDYDDS